MRPDHLSDIDLVPLCGDHTDLVHALFTNPETWRHVPTGRFTDRSQSEEVVADNQRSWAEHGLGNWAVFERAEGGLAREDRAAHGQGFLGMVGVCRIPSVAAWNLGFRLAPAAWGRGIATRVGALAITRAHKTHPDVPVTARALTSNPASLRVLEKTGLRLRWEGPASIPVPVCVLSRIFSDRRLSDDVLDWLVKHA